MPNRLAHEKSPYLRQHADNPVDWYPWGAGALDRARAEGKPVFLSIGYSTCHWCHVMAHESFENPEVATLLNRDYVAVKLDREERPDLDRVYMTYVQQTTGHGGWPMSVWLTPEGKPFYGGTYFPRDDRDGRPGFASLLKLIAQHWREQREKLEGGAEEVMQALRRHAAGGAAADGEAPAGAAAPLHEAAGEAYEKAFEYFHEAHDSRWGGFGRAPKFPRASILDFLFRSAAIQGVETDLGQEAIGMAATTLQRMAEGGIHDPIGGGFHRYSVDAEWHVPHFEKMLYDQALVALNYLEALQATQLPVFGWIARDIFGYVARDLTSPDGAFYSAEDADSEIPHPVPEPQIPDPKAQAPNPRREASLHAEGAFYVWTQSELEAVLGADAPFFCAHYDVKPDGNVAHDPQGEFRGKNVLRQLRSLARTAAQFQRSLPEAETTLVSCLDRLQAVRLRRPRPHRDDKVITAWNGLMISALARGARVLNEPAHLSAAGRAAEFLQRELWDEPTLTLYRSWREGRGDVIGFAEDYACLIQGLLDLYEAGFDVRWLRWADQLQTRMDALFWDRAQGGYFSSRADDALVVLRLKEDYDGAEPAAGSVAVTNLIRLEWLLGGDERGDRALRTVESLRPQWSRHPHALPQLLAALEAVLSEPRTLVLAGNPKSPDFQALALASAANLSPRRVLLAADGGEGQRWLAGHRPYLADMKPVDGRATAYVCENFTCQAPVTSADALRALLNKS